MKVTDLRRKLFAALASGGLLVPSTLPAANLNTNLVVNPGFENVAPKALPADVSVRILDWGGTTPGFAYSHDNTDSIPDYANGAPLASGGHYYFTPGAGGNQSLGAALTQNIDVSTGATAAAIASGTAGFNLSAFFGSYLGQLDHGIVQVNFLNAASTSIGSAQLNPGLVNFAEWTPQSTSGSIPAGTQTVRVSAWGTLEQPGTSDGYMDNIDFRVTNILPALSISVDRTSGAISFSNSTGSGKNISGYSITSASEALFPGSWVSIADNYDSGNPGSNQIDATHAWTELTNSATRTDLSEADLQAGTGASYANNRTVSLGNAGTWIRNPNEDLVFQYVSGGQVTQGVVIYTGNGSQPFAIGDLNTDGSINTADWVILRTNQHTDLSAKSIAEAYRLGDLTGDHLNDHADFITFKTAYDTANVSGSFDAMISSVPEPGMALLVIAAGLLVIPFFRRK